MKKKVSEILNVHYVEGNISCEPSKEEIKKAVDEKNLETRGYALESHIAPADRPGTCSQLA